MLILICAAPTSLTDRRLQGQNLILNMNDKGFTVVAYNRTTSKVDAFLANEAKGQYALDLRRRKF